MPRDVGKEGKLPVRLPKRLLRSLALGDVNDDAPKPGDPAIHDNR